MIDQLRKLFSAYPNLTVTGRGWSYVVNNGGIIYCYLLIDEGGMYDVWFPYEGGYTCLSQNMVKVLYDALLLLNEEVL